MALLEEFGEVDNLMSILLSNADEILRDMTFAEQVIERGLQICLLAKGVRTRGCQHLLRALGGKMTREPLKDITVGICRTLGLDLVWPKKRSTRVDTFVADEP